MGDVEAASEGLAFVGGGADLPGKEGGDFRVCSALCLRHGDKYANGGLASNALIGWRRKVFRRTLRRRSTTRVQPGGLP